MAKKEGEEGVSKWRKVAVVWGCFGLAFLINSVKIPYLYDMAFVMGVKHPFNHWWVRFFVFYVPSVYYMGWLLNFFISERLMRRRGIPVQYSDSEFFFTNYSFMPSASELGSSVYTGDGAGYEDVYEEVTDDLTKLALVCLIGWSSACAVKFVVEVVHAKDLGLWSVAVDLACTMAMVSVFGLSFLMNWRRYYRRGGRDDQNQLKCLIQDFLRSGYEIGYCSLIIFIVLNIPVIAYLAVASLN